MNDTTIFQRTELGQKTFSDSKAALTQAERTLLIMIDGRKPLSELRKLSVVIGNCEAVLTRLTQDKLIEAIATKETPTISIAPTASVGVGEMNTTHEQFERARRSATRFINQTLGTYGEKIALLVERSKTSAELREHLGTAERIIREFKGANVAREFKALVRDELSS